MNNEAHISGDNLLDTQQTDKQTSKGNHVGSEAEETVKPKKGSPVMKLTHYMKKHTMLFVVGIITLFGGQLGEFAVPAYIGMVIDTLAKAKPDAQEQINTYVV